MAHPTGSEAVDVPASHTVSSAATALSQMFQAEVPVEEEASAPASEDEFADDDFSDIGEEVEGDTGEQEGEPDEPAIAAPASLTADEKAAFAQLPPEAQEFVSSLETRRNQNVQEVTTKAAEAQRRAEEAEQQADIKARQVYAQQLKQFADALAPQMPDRSQYSDMPTFNAAMARYEQAMANHQTLVEEVEGMQTEATAQEEQAFIQQRDREMMAIPEIANPETRQAYIERAMSVADELGYDKAELVKGMTASDFKALAKVADLKEKADKYDAAMSRKMQRVRAGKARGMKPGSAQPERSVPKAYSDAKQRLQRTGSVRDAASALKAFL